MSWTWSCLPRVGAALKLQSSGWKRWLEGCLRETDVTVASAAAVTLAEQLFDLWDGGGFKGTCQYLSVEWLDSFCIPILCKEARVTVLRLFSFKTTGCPPIARLTSGRTSIGFLPKAKRYVSFWQFESEWLIVAKYRGAAVDIFETVDTCLSRGWFQHLPDSVSVSWLKNSGAGCVTDFTDSQGREGLAAVSGFPDSRLMVPYALWDCFWNTASQYFEHHFPYHKISLNLFFRTLFSLGWRLFNICKVKFTTLEIAGIWKLQWKISQWNFIQVDGLLTAW